MVLKVGGIVLSLLQIVLGIVFIFTSDIIDKSLKISKVFLEKGFKVRPCD